MITDVVTSGNTAQVAPAVLFAAHVCGRSGDTNLASPHLHGTVITERLPTLGLAIVRIYALP